jgi:hypothetical protein
LKRIPYTNSLSFLSAAAAPSSIFLSCLLACRVCTILPHLLFPPAHLWPSGVVSSLNRDLFVVAASLSRHSKKRSRCGRSGVIKYRLNLDFSFCAVFVLFLFFLLFLHAGFVHCCCYQETPRNEVFAFTGE